MDTVVACGADIGGVLYRNPLDRISGYAAAGREYVYCLAANGVDVKAAIFNSSEDSALLSPEEKGYFLSLQSKNIEYRTIIHNMVPNLWQREEGKNNIGFMFWETDKFPKMWYGFLGQADKFWVCWDVTKTALMGAGVPEYFIKVIPPVVNTNTFNPGIKPLQLNTGRGFNFVSVFQYSYRKGLDVLLKAYYEEFEVNDEVCLVLKGYGQDSSAKQETILKEWIRWFKRVVPKSAYPKIAFRGGVIANNVFANFLRSGDVFVLPTRGEGLGMPMLQSMACGVPVITTGWGAQTQFVNNDNGWMIDYGAVNVSNMFHSPAYEADHRWAEPNQDHLRSLMREAYNNREMVIDKGIKARATIENSYGYDKAGLELIKAV